MFGYLYDWLRDISYYLILVTAVTYVLPSNSYRKYIRFFTGLVLILLLLTPVFQLFNKNDFTIGNLYSDLIEDYENQVAEKVDDVKIQIEVEEIMIGP